MSPISNNSDYAIYAKDLVKMYPGTLALNRVDFKLKKGQVIGLLGKNGSGKSTLINILAGMIKKTAGDIYYFGKKVDINNVQDSENLGFRFVSQEPYLMDDLSIAENIALREKELKYNFKSVNWEEINKTASKKLKRLNIALDPTIPSRYLKVSEKQLILTIREVLSTGARIVALDEVGAALSKYELETIFDLIREEKKRGMSFIYISHEIDEVFEICDSVIVIRDGEIVLEGDISDLTSMQLKEVIAGRDLKDESEAVSKKEFRPSDVVLKVRDLSNEKLRDISFDVHKGEILGVYGLRGAGRTELLTTLFGLMPADSGTVEFRGKDVLKLTPAERLNEGISFVPEDRSEGVFDCRPIRDNLFMSSLEKNLCKNNLLIDFKQEEKKYYQIKDEFDVMAESIENEIAYLSGGNKQKIMFARCRVAEALLYLIDEGTKGIDIGAKFEIYDLMNELASNGDSFIYTSSDLDEICRISHRIMILYNGAITAILDRDEIRKDLVLHYADGNKS
ncbi:MAG: sugar ABC transporter ATP-binding protein [Firmicutes bacterium]|nr:sugar ABC transporter ATP-binding protein [Bacillota bacterium]